MTLVRLPSDAAADDIVEHLDRDGYALVEGYLDRAEAARLAGALRPVLDATPLGRNDFEGFNTKRIYALLAKTRAFDQLSIDDRLLTVVERVLGPSPLFSAPVGIEIGPDSPGQGLHYDQAVYPLSRSRGPVVLNSMWPLCDFTEANGATRVIPGSHRWEDGRHPEGDEWVAVEMSAGSALFYTGTLWHGGGANRTDAWRLGVILEYVSGWLRPQETHLVSVPQDVAITLPKRLQQLIGLGTFPPFLGYSDGRDPARVLAKRLGAGTPDPAPKRNDALGFDLIPPR